MEKVKVLSYVYDDGTGYKAVRVYPERYFEQAQKDYEMMLEYASDCRKWSLSDAVFLKYN